MIRLLVIEKQQGEKWEPMATLTDDDGNTVSLTLSDLLHASFLASEYLADSAALSRSGCHVAMHPGGSEVPF